jgi:hypothetical protein
MDKKLAIKKIAAELNEIRKELRRLAAKTSPTKDGAKSLFKAYKKKHPTTKKTLKDFYKPSEDGEGSKEVESVKDESSGFAESGSKEMVKQLKNWKGKVQSKTDDLMSSMGQVGDALKSGEFEKMKPDSITSGKKNSNKVVETKELPDGAEFENSALTVDRMSNATLNGSMAISEAADSSITKSKITGTNMIGFSEINDSEITDSEVIVPSKGVIKKCKIKGGTRFYGDPKTMIFDNCDFEDQDYMDDLISAGARFTGQTDDEEEITVESLQSEIDGYLKKRKG